jgi:hypothetical protein
MLIRELAISSSLKKIIEGREVFLVRVYNEDKVVESVIQSILDK